MIIRSREDSLRDHEAWLFKATLAVNNLSEDMPLLEPFPNNCRSSIPLKVLTYSFCVSLHLLIPLSLPEREDRESHQIVEANMTALSLT